MTFHSSPKNQEFWTEFDWETELRKDDARVNTYLKELPSVIDLPHEDEVIYNRIKKHDELVPHGGQWPLPPFEKNLPPPLPPEEAKKEAKEWMRREGADVYSDAGECARNVAIAFAESKNLENRKELFRILTLVGKIMTRTADVADLDPDEMPSLRTALAKRAARDVNSLIGLLNKVSFENDNITLVISDVYEMIMSVRDRLSDIAARSRKRPPKDFLHASDDEDEY